MIYCNSISPSNARYSSLMRKKGLFDIMLDYLMCPFVTQVSHTVNYIELLCTEIITQCS
jgi:hypothetical protein